MTRKELEMNRFWLLYGESITETASVVVTILAIFLPLVIAALVWNKTKNHKKKKLRDGYIKVKVEMVDLIWNKVPSSYQLKMVYAHPKDNKNRYYFTEKIYYDPVMNNDVSLNYEYDMYVHPDDPMSYYVDVSNYVKNYPSFETWIRRI